MRQAFVVTPRGEIDGQIGHRCHAVDDDERKGARLMGLCNFLGGGPERDTTRLAPLAQEPAQPLPGTRDLSGLKQGAERKPLFSPASVLPGGTRIVERVTPQLLDERRALET